LGIIIWIQDTHDQESRDSLSRVQDTHDQESQDSLPRVVSSAMSIVAHDLCSAAAGASKRVRGSLYDSQYHARLLSRFSSRGQGLELLAPDNRTKSLTVVVVSGTGTGTETTETTDGYKYKYNSLFFQQP
jgi:hypothetical protein